MKKLLLFSITVLLTCKAISQTFRTQDSSVIANKDLRKAAVLIEQGKSCLVELNLQRRQNDLLQQRVDVKDSIISHHVKTEDNLNQQIKNYDLMNENYKEQITLRDAGIKQLEKSLKRQKTKTVFVGIAGTMSSLGLFYLLVR